jgi:ABC-2 type transport system ATP-binding protein
VTAALSLRKLHKAFGPKTAVDNLSLDVPAASLFGVVGPNGAGKTTTLRMATGLLRPDGGSAAIDGTDVWTDPVRAKQRVGVLPEDLALFERLTGRQLLEYTGLLRSLPADVVAQRSGQLLSVLGLEDAAGALVADYSHGMRKKITLAAALLHGPSLLVLDEPFEGIDPLSARTIRSVLDRHLANGGTVVLSSHVMELVERLCDHIAVLHVGRLVAAGPIQAVRGAHPTLEDAFVALVGGGDAGEADLGWLGSSSA